MMMWLALSVCLAGCLSLCSAAGSSYGDPDVNILDRALQSSMAKAVLLGDKITMLTSRSNSLLSALDSLDDTNFEDLDNANSAQDDQIAAAQDRLNDLMADLQDVQGQAADANKVADVNRGMLQDLWDQVDDLGRANDNQDAQLAGLDNTMDDVETKVDEILNDLVEEADQLNMNLIEQVNITEELFDTRRCFTAQTTVNLTNNMGTMTVFYSDNFFPSLAGEMVIPDPYCAITGIVSHINEDEKKSHGYGYGYSFPSEIERTGFSLDCQITPSGVTATVVDRSRSEKGLDKTASVSVAIKACTLTGQGGFNYNLS